MFTGLFKVANRKKKKAVNTKDFVQLGVDGSYFNDLDDAYLNSPTATMCLLKFLEYCVPIGLLPAFINLWNKVKSDYARYGYYVLLVTYDIDGKRQDVIYKNPRHFLVKDKDDNGNASTYINTETGVIYPAFNNSSPGFVKSQWAKLDQGYKSYTGQIYMFNDGSLPYRITPMYSVLDWMKTESDSSTYVSKACDNAMFGNNIFVMKKSSDASARELEVIETVKETLTSVKGVNESNQNILLEWEGEVDDVPKLINKISISNDLDADLLNNVDDKAIAKISMACYGFPMILVATPETVFGNSGASLEVAESFWSQTCLKQADNILTGFAEIGLKIVSEQAEEAPVIDNTTAEAQAALRGTVGGGQLVLTTQQAVAAKTATPESARALFELVLGFSEQDAIRLLGNPTQAEPAATPLKSV
jgi:hypothetical protein